ncbi:unnamed protein product [Periconia digitata]|uniref:Uncharacterized protein n=1 Tax=Periconia digitata TaxID=1303443 RepID=A0A9W4UHX8_9PLEO|nr:unnamed protein product [Periconia digitata]
MPAMSRGPVTASKLRAPKHVKGGTASSRNHRFEGFSSRIAKLKIEPVRRGRSTILDDAELENTFSYFHDALVEWRDLNISDTFSRFARQAAPLSDSLPQVIHHSERILDLLMEYIEKGDKHSEEPLLNLLAHLAHDLGARFETYFERAVRTVSHLAATHADVEVIEWSFTCLAWLFKYLSRLLVPDLRPLFDLMAPLLGKQHQKSFVSRFASDSLSFLVRKAGAVHHRDSAPLRLLIKHITEQLKDLQGSGKDHEFQQGLMSLFAESIKGVQRGLHSSAVAVTKELLVATYDAEYKQFRTPPLQPILEGVITATIHHTDAEHFKSVLETIFTHVQTTDFDSSSLAISSRLIFIVCGVRKGSRVAEWSPILDALDLLIDGTDSFPSLDLEAAQSYQSAVSVVYQYCPLDAAIPHVQSLEKLSRGPWEKHFLTFCVNFADLGAERFNTLLMSYFKRYVSQKAHEHIQSLYLVLPTMYRKGYIPASAIQCSTAWQEAMINQFELFANAQQSSDDLAQIAYECNAVLDAMDSLVLAQDRKHTMAKHLHRALQHSLEITEFTRARPVDIVAAGKGLCFLAENGDMSDSLLDLWPLLCSASAVYGHILPFWKGLLALAKMRKGIMDRQGPHMEVFKQALMHCLGSPSQDLRLIALELLKFLTPQDTQLETAIATATIIEQTPANMDTQRSISMRIGQLSSLYPEIASNEWIGEAIPTFCFGLLHKKLASVWNDTCAALKAMCTTNEGESHITQIAFQWIAQPETENLTANNPTSPSIPRYGTEFQCTNLMRLEYVITENQNMFEFPSDQILTRHNVTHGMMPFITPFSRTQALRVLNEIPSVAEKRSRTLVPVLLDWTSEQRVEGDSEDEPQPEETKPHRWSRKDQKAMLSVFSKFVNPKVLFKSAEVYEALLALLANGDVEIQKASLEALVTWKDPAVTTYKENLFFLLDDARFRDEVSHFLDVGTDNSLVKAEHRDRLLPVLLRLLYGRVISGKRGLETKRKAVFQTLIRFEGDAINQFLAIALGNLNGISIIRGNGLDEGVLQEERINPRRQLGMLTMLEDMLSTLQTTFRPFIDQIIDPILYCLIRASRELSKESVASNSETNASSLTRLIRQRSLASVNILFGSCPTFSWGAYPAAIVTEMINPRIQQLPIESAQSVSGILRLFAAWSKSLHTATFLVDHNPEIMSKIIEILGIVSAKDEVKRFVLDEIIRSLISLATNTDVPASDKILRNKVHSNILQPFSNSMLVEIGGLLRKSPSKELLESGVHAIAELAPHVIGSAESRSMLEISSFLLRQPTNRVSPQTKLGLLRILHEFVPRCNDNDLVQLFGTVYDAICPLFSYFKDRASRAILCDIIQDLATTNQDLSSLADLCHSLNAFSASRLDEPDFDRRAAAFDVVTGDAAQSYSLAQWKPLVFNMLYFIRDNQELGIRVNASLSLRRFIQVSIKDEEYRNFISAAILPGIQNGMRESSELVRVEFLAVLAQLIDTYHDWKPVADLRLLVSGDEESSFFSNILHIQGHRRLRALRRLVSQATLLQSGNIYHILLPLLEHFVFNKAEGEGANSLSGETIKTISALSQGLEWPQFRSLFKRYSGYLTSKEDMQKTMIKLLAGLMDGLSRSGLRKGYAINGRRQDDEPTTHESHDVDAMEVDVALPTPALVKTLPQQEKLATDLIGNILPDMTEFLRKKDDSTVSLRVPIAVAVTKVLLVLPPAEMELRLPALLLDIGHILKSRAQDARDLARNTLSDIACITGPAYLGFIIKALRIALQRGSHLHVLSFTLHSILVKLSEQLQPGDLDYCLPDIVDVILDDTFGLTGQEKDAEDYTSKMKEVKSSKSFDSMDLIARSATPTHLVDLIAPIRSLLLEKLNSRAVQKIDELLRRIGLGIFQNPSVQSRDMLVFCYELIQDVYKATQNPKETHRVDPKNKRYLINMKGASKSGARLSTSSYTFKIIRFSLDLLRTVLRKNEGLQTPKHLTGFLPIVGDALVAGQEEVQVSAIRLISTIIKVPMPELDESCPVYVDEAVRSIKGAPSSNTEIAQASLKLITSVLRERPNVEIKERHLAELLKRIRPDLDEPDRQGVTFGFLKAVMNRKIVIAEVYEVMDTVAAMMITNHTRSARDVARSNYFNFLMEYPQAKNRFRKQVEFLLKNLRYDHVEGRQSVMEALNLLLNKVGDDALQEELGMMFIPLVHSMVNDDSSDCRTMAGALLTKVFERADPKRLKSFTVDLRSWLEQDDNLGMKRLGIQCWDYHENFTRSTRRG